MVDGRFLVHPHGVLPEGLCLLGHHPLHQLLVEFRSHLPHVRLVDVEDDVRDLRPYLVVFLLLLLGEFLVFLRGQRLLLRFVGVDVQRRVEDDDLRLFSFPHVHRLVPFLFRDSSLLVHQLLVHLLDLVERGVDGRRVVVGHGRHHEVERVAARVLPSADVLREAVPGALRARPSHLPVGAFDDLCVGHEFVVHVGQRCRSLFAVLSFGVVFLSHGFIVVSGLFLYLWIVCCRRAMRCPLLPGAAMAWVGGRVWETCPCLRLGPVLSVHLAVGKAVCFSRLSSCHVGITSGVLPLRSDVACYAFGGVDGKPLKAFAVMASTQISGWGWGD